MNEIINKELMTYLGQVGRAVPCLSSHEWTKIFEFIEYFSSVEYDDNRASIPSFNWKKVMEILSLLGKVK